MNAMKMASEMKEIDLEIKARTDLAMREETLKSGAQRAMDLRRMTRQYQCQKV